MGNAGRLIVVDDGSPWWWQSAREVSRVSRSLSSSVHVYVKQAMLHTVLYASSSFTRGKSETSYNMMAFLQCGRVTRSTDLGKDKMKSRRG
jgi:acid phosphatase class B